MQNVLNIASLVIVSVLFVVSLFIISNTVKLAMYSRSEEIAIMKMVGATNAFIRLPFIVEGFIIGIIAAAVGFFRLRDHGLPRGRVRQLAVHPEVPEGVKPGGTFYL